LFLPLLVLEWAWGSFQLVISPVSHGYVHDYCQHAD
jgi:hypothetical protein